jgi:thiamine biosynthesis lipoprotein
MNHFINFNRCRQTIIVIIVILSSTALTSCGSSTPPLFHESAWIMGTVVEITWIKRGKSSRESVRQAFENMKTVDRLMTPNTSDSDIGKLNRSGSNRFVQLFPLTCRVIKEGQTIFHETGGAFDITLGPLIKLWGWDRKDPSLPSREHILGALSRIGTDKLTCDFTGHRARFRQKGMSIDLGGIAKGFAVDQACKILNKGGLKNYIVNAGGDLFASGQLSSRLWRIGLQDPENRNAIIASLSVSGIAVATSGDYEQYFIKNGVRYHHILSPVTGYPARGLHSVTVLAPTTMEADALATALFVMGREKAVQWLSQHSAYQAILVDTSRRIFASKTIASMVKWEKKCKNNVIYF